MARPRISKGSGLLSEYFDYIFSLIESWSQTYLGVVLDCQDWGG